MLTVEPVDVTSLGAKDAMGPEGIAAADFLKTKIADVRSTISGMSLSKTIPIGTADAGSYFNSDIVEACDYCMANVHPWYGNLRDLRVSISNDAFDIHRFASVTIDQSAGWTADFFQMNDVDLAKNTTKNPTFYIAETGWPTVRIG